MVEAVGGTAPAGAVGDFRAAGVLIPARGERQAMDWSLVLASQEIRCAIHPPSATMGWALEVDSRDAGPALRSLRQYHRENRRWHTPLAPGAQHLVFHWGVLLWCLLLLVLARAVDAPGSLLRERAIFDTAATATGEWWRPLTATFLHSGIDHLAANLTTGFLLVGLAMGRYGVGPALLGTLLAGVGGNLLAWLWRGRDYLGLGASGVVMAALGMLSVSLAADARHGRISPAVLLRSVLGGIFLFILLGTAPHSDVLAHLGGFLSGAALGLPLALLPRRGPAAITTDSIAAALYLGLVALGLGAALR